jgi:hypothetical protein
MTSASLLAAPMIEKSAFHANPPRRGALPFAPTDTHHGPTPQPTAPLGGDVVRAARAGPAERQRQARTACCEA